jgi:hypothetical protein
MLSKLPRLLLFGLWVACFSISSGLPAKNAEPVYAGLTVHEWGTFTSIAGRGGQAVEWSPLTGPSWRKRAIRRRSSCSAAINRSTRSSNERLVDDRFA